MKYDWLDEYCLSKRGVRKDFKAEWNATRYMLNGKMFAMQGGDKEGNPIITVKLDPMFGQLLRNRYRDIVPGYYMNKEHWNTVTLGADVPVAEVHRQIEQSYDLIKPRRKAKMKS